MKAVLALIVFGFVAVFAEDHYTTKYDEIDIDNIINSPRLIKNYIQCLKETGKCNEEGKVLKEVVPDALLTSCKKCNEHQRKSTDKVIRFLIKNYRKDWDELVTKYDAQGTHRKNYQKYYDEILGQ